MKKLLEEAMNYVDDVEVFFQQESIEQFNIEDSSLKDIDTKIQSGYSLRIIKDGKLGFAYTRNLNNREGLVRNALDSLNCGVRADFDFPSDKSKRELETFSDELKNTDINDILKESQRVTEKLSGKVNGQINIETSRSLYDIKIINSSGLNCSSSFSDYELNTSILFPGSYSSIERQIKSKSFDRVTAEYLDFISDLYNSSGEVVKPGGGRKKVLFLPEVMYVLVWRLLSATSGKNIYKKESPLIDRIGDKIFHEDLDIYDNPLDDNEPNARSFDDEGVETEKLDIIKNGVLSNFYFDLKYAGKLNKESTGHGYRETVIGGSRITTKPEPALLHLGISPGIHSLEELISMIDDGLIIAGALGAHSGNIPNGDFSIGLSPGLKVEKGEITGRVKDVMVAGNIYDVMKNIVGIEDRAYNAFMGKFPAILFDDVSVAVMD